MNTVLKIAFVALGVGLSSWLLLVAYDVGNDYRRFARFAGGDRRAARTPRTPAPSLTPGERADGVV